MIFFPIEKADQANSYIYSPHQAIIIENSLCVKHTKGYTMNETQYLLSKSKEKRHDNGESKME